MTVCFADISGCRWASDNVKIAFVFAPLAQATKLVQLEGETSNQLFDTLADWDHHLKANGVLYQDLQP